MKKRMILQACMAMLISLTTNAQQTLDLSGEWQLTLGDTLGGTTESVVLPGSLLTNGKGNEVSVHTRWTGSLYDSSYFFNPYMEKYRVEGKMKFPFFLTPEKHYVGKAWYTRTIDVPKSWKKRHITLFLERPHIETTVYVNGLRAGHQMSLSAPHQYDVTALLKPGTRNQIAICVYNGIENVGVGQDSHSVTDQTQGNWNGIVGRMELQVRPANLRIESVRITPKPKDGVVHVDVCLDGKTIRQRKKQTVTVAVWQDGKQEGKVSKRFVTNGNSLSADIPVGDGSVLLWDEFHPHLYQLEVTAGDDRYNNVFGMRDVTVDGRNICVNGQPVWLRGTVENCCFPETGYPPTDETSWMRIFKKVKQYGLNHVRFHSYCPPDAAFAAADKIGIYLQPEGPSWPNHGVRLRRGQVIDQYLIAETKRIIDTYGHHPSFVMLAAGNEPAGDWVSYCNDWVKEMKRYDSSRIYCGASVGGGWAWDNGSEYHVKGGARGLDWTSHAPCSDDDYSDQIAFPRNYKDTVPNNSPIIAHEQGQWCAFPDFKEMTQYTGVYKARNFEIFRDLLRDNGMEGQAESFLMASGKLQTLCYKYEIERNLRTPDYAGFQLLALNDYSGQGTALEGVLNVHWNEKGYTSAQDWTEFCAPVVPLARFSKFVFTDADTLRVPVEVYNAGGHMLAGAKAVYTICNEDSATIASGCFFSGDIPMGKNCQLGEVSLPLECVKDASKLTMSVTVAGKWRNHWDFWVYPSSSKCQEASFLVADSLDSQALSVLKKGGKVLLTAAGKIRLGSDVVQHYLPVFWNTSWFKMRPPHTTGALIDKSHPLFKHGFPTDSWSDLNWWELLNRAQVMNLMELPRDYQSPVQPIDTWHISRKLGMIVEAKVLNGKLLMTTLDITTDLQNRHVARQMRNAIISYMQSDSFNPALSLSAQVIQDFYTKDGPQVSMFTKESPDELKPAIK